VAEQRAVDALRRTGHRLGHHDRDELLLGIDPETGAGRAASFTRWFGVMLV
jgi:hypothetical protein